MTMLAKIYCLAQDIVVPIHLQGEDTFCEVIGACLACGHCPEKVDLYPLIR